MLLAVVQIQIRGDLGAHERAGISIHPSLLRSLGRGTQIQTSVLITQLLYGVIHQVGEQKVGGLPFWVWFFLEANAPARRVSTLRAVLA